MIPLSLNRLYKAVVAANALSKTASLNQDAAQHAATSARNVMLLAKRAGEEVSLINKLVRKALGGLAVGAGAAVPATVAGSYLADQIGERSAAESQKMRDFLENAALSLAGAGLGIYALHNLGEGNELGYDDKFAAYHDKAQTELTEKLATIGVIDAWLENWAPSSEDETKLASELRSINDAYLVKLLSEAIGA